MNRPHSFWTPLLTVLFAAAGLASCVTVKQQTYLQPLPEASTTINSGQMPQMPDYRLQPYDIIQIKVKSSNPEIDALYNKQSTQGNLNMFNGPAPMYFVGYHVLPNGQVDIPNVGQVTVSGQTLFEAKKSIHKALGRLFSDTNSYNVDVALAGVRYTIMGEAKQPGVHYLYLDRGTIMDAIANSGDLTLLANKRKVQVLRQVNNEWHRFNLDLTSSDVLSDPRFYLQPNDLISVNPLPQKSWGFGQTGFASFTSLLSVLSTTLTLYIALNR